MILYVCRNGFAGHWFRSRVRTCHRVIALRVQWRRRWGVRVIRCAECVAVRHELARLIAEGRALLARYE